MKEKYQSSWSCIVQREGSELEVTSVLNSTAYEACVIIRVNVMNLEIQTARWDAYRSPDGDIARNGEIQSLIGLDIHKFSTKLVVNTLDSDLRGILSELLAEGIRGAVQSEPYTLKERGYLSYKQFDDMVVKVLLDSCVCYTNIDPVKRESWTDYMDEWRTTRTKHLFNRNKSYHLAENLDGSLLATACLTDAYHELLLTVTISPNSQIQEISGTLLRSPEKVCSECVKLFPQLLGKNLEGMSKKEIGTLVGGSDGCTHFVEMCYDLGMALSQLSILEQKGFF